ncbi:condensin complex subunit 2-like isoform X2 [Dysidea avara]
MAQMLKSKGNMTNFQVAGCTLDAGAKIYAGRVDAMYNDVYKMLGGLGRSNRAEQEGSGDEEGEEEPGKGKSKHAKGKKLHSNGCTSQIVKDVSSINTDHYDLEFEVDPLFKKMSATFDEGGVAGLLINQLRLDSDQCQLMLDASSRISSGFTSLTSIPIDASSLRRHVPNLATAKICPTLAGFSLASEANQDEWNTSLLLSSTKKPPQSPGHFLNMSGVDATQLHYSSNDEGDGDMIDDEAEPLPHFNDDVPLMADDCTASFRDDLVMPRPDSNEQQTRPPLSELLEPSEYSYFSQAAVEAWAGPQHWKLRIRPKRQEENNNVPGDKPTTGVKRQIRKTFTLDFSTSISASQLEHVNITSRKLRRAQIEKMTTEQTTLPHTECISEKQLLHLFSQPTWIIKRWQRRNTIEDEANGGQELYDYNNAFDQENYCPMVMDTAGDHSDDDDRTDAGGNSTYPYNDTVLMNNTEDITCDLSCRNLTGVNLVTAPNKIEQIRVNFARQAKRINMQKLKAGMWTVITDKQHGVEDQENHEDHSTDKPKDTDRLLFSQLYSKLPATLPQAMVKEVSVPIAFVSLLHLANEKSLTINDSGDDLSIWAPPTVS